MTKAPPSPPKPSRLRRLSDDEIDLWLTVAASIERRADSRLPDRVARPIPTAPEPPPPGAASPVTPSPQPKQSKPPPLAPLERKLKQKLSRGRMTADAAIDLHGFRQGEAYHALHRFLARSRSQGARVVLVVTGKGGRPGLPFGVGDLSDTWGGETGVLRRSVPLWLNMPDFRPMVVGFEEAARQHGGSGALYVRLRRRERGAD